MEQSDNGGRQAKNTIFDELEKTHGARDASDLFSVKQIIAYKTKTNQMLICNVRFSPEGQRK